MVFLILFFLMIGVEGSNEGVIKIGLYGIKLVVDRGWFCIVSVEGKSEML